MSEIQTINQRKNLSAEEIILQLLDYLGMKPKQFLDKIGENPTTIQDIKKGKTKNISKRLCNKITDSFPEISRSFLLDGELPIVKQNDIQVVETPQSIKGKLLMFISEYKRISKNEFYLQCDLANGFLDKDRGFNVNFLPKILTVYPELNPDWLLLGKGEMIRKEYQSVGDVTNSTLQSVNVNKSNVTITNGTTEDAAKLRKQNDELQATNKILAEQMNEALRRFWELYDGSK